MHGKRLISFLPSAIASKCRVEHPYALNHQIIIRIEGEDIWKVCDMLRSQVVAKHYKINNSEFTNAVEPSPLRKQQCRAYFSAWDAIKSMVATTQYEPDTKGLAIYHLPSYDLLGRVEKGATTFAWNQVVCAAHSLDFDALSSYRR